MSFIIKMECEYEDADNCPKHYDCLECLNINLPEYIRALKEIETW